MSWFENLFEARGKIAAWRREYNEERPHSSLGYRTPKEFAAAQAAGFYTAERGARDSNAVPCPCAPPSRLKPEMEQKKFVVFLRERKLGAGHSLADSPRRIASRHHSPERPSARLRRRFQPRVLFLAHFETDGFRAQRRLHHVPASSLAITAETSSRA